MRNQLRLRPGQRGTNDPFAVRDRDGHRNCQVSEQGRRSEHGRMGGRRPDPPREGGHCVPEWRLESIAEKTVLLLRRFDREAGARMPFLSVMSMLDARKRSLELSGIRGRASAAWRGTQAGHAPSLAAHRFQHPDFENGRPPPPLTDSCGRAGRLAPVPGI